MPDSVVYLPVFLPGRNHDWDKIDAVATITPEGEVNIKLPHKNVGLALVDMAKAGILVDLTFSYLKEK